MSGLVFGLLVVAVKGVVSIDQLVITVGPDQLNYGAQPKGVMISRCEDRVGSLQVLSLKRPHSRDYRPRRIWLHLIPHTLYIQI
jgi:hypothetical protein